MNWINIILDPETNPLGYVFRKMSIWLLFWSSHWRVQYFFLEKYKMTLKRNYIWIYIVQFFSSQFLFGLFRKMFKFFGFKMSKKDYKVASWCYSQKSSFILFRGGVSFWNKYPWNTTMKADLERRMDLLF